MIRFKLRLAWLNTTSLRHPLVTSLTAARNAIVASDYTGKPGASRFEDQ